MKYTVTVERSRRRSLSIEVKEDGNVLVKAPLHLPDEKIRGFLDEKQEWIAGAVETARRKKEALADVQVLSGEEVRKLGEEALQFFPERCSFYARQLDVSYGRITVRNQKSRWGSCSAKGNLNFNVGLMLAPPEVRDYVVVHELCHRIEMNHSPAFWRQVERILPDYRERRKWLRYNGDAIMKQIHG